MSLLAILDITTKAELKEHCKRAVIHGDDLANLILASQAGVIPVVHAPIFKHHEPGHLTLNQDDLIALVENGVGKMEPKARKAAGKIGSMFKERRLLNGHLFCPLRYENEWHFFYFDQRDTSKNRNHWREGSHIHLLNWVTHPRWSLGDLSARLDASERPQLTGSLHIRFSR